MSVSNPKFLWSGEHWILYLRQPGEFINTVSVSLYKTIYSNAGIGTVCLLQSDPKYGIEPKLLTDNREVAEFVRKYIISWKVSPFSDTVVTQDAKFELAGDIRINPEWHIVFEGQKVIAKWFDLEPCILVNSPIDEDNITVAHSLLTFCKGGTVSLNENNVEGELFIRDTWKNLLGEPKSSGCFALSETLATN